MFPRRMSLLEVRMTLEDSSLNLLYMTFVSGSVSLSQVDATVNPLYLSGVTTY